MEIMNVTNVSMGTQNQVSQPREGTPVREAAKPPITDGVKGSHSEKTSTPDKEQQAVEDARKDIEALNNHLAATSHALRFSVDDKSDEVVVKVVDTETDQVIKQIPPEEIVRLRQHMKDLTGLLVEEKA